MKSGCRVFIIAGDRELVRELVVRLDRLGCHVCGQASSAPAALEQVPAAVPGLILLDPGLPDAATIADRLQQDPAVAPLILLVSDAGPATRERVAGIDCRGCVLSGCTDAELAVALAAAEGGARRRRERQTMHESILQGLAWGIIALSPEGRIVFLNSRAALLLGVDPAAAAGRDCRTLLPPSDLEGRPFNPLAVAPDAVSSVLLRLAPADGQERIVRVDGAAGDAAAPFVLTLADVTDRERSRQEMLTLARISAENPDPVLQVTGEGVISYCNAASFTFLDITASALGRTIHPVLRGRISAVLLHGAAETLETRFGEYDFSITIVPFPMDGYVILYVRDITQRNRAARKLEESEQRYRAVVDDQMEMICRFSPEGRLSFYNNSFAEYYSPGALDPRLAARLLEAAVELDTEHQVLSVEYAAYRGGEPVWQEWVLRGLFDGDGRLEEIQGVGRDVSDRKRMESLEEAKAAAEAANLAKTTFISNMSHEIRTPMNGIMGNADLLLRSGLSRYQAEIASVIQASSRSLLGIINDILDFSRMEAGKLELREDPFDLFLLLEELGGLLGPEAFGKGIEFYIRYPLGENRMVTGDRGRIRQVLLNLLGNAVKFTHHGHVMLQCEAEGGGYRFAVRDTGIGISPEVQEQVFERFQQADSSLTRTYGGAGLGLAISRQLAQQLGGGITLQSAPGQGSVFTLHLPLPGTWPAGQETPPGASGLRLLYLDGEAEGRRVFLELAHHFGVVAQAVALPDEVMLQVGQGEWNGIVFSDSLPPETIPAVVQALTGCRDRCCFAVLLSPGRVAGVREDLCDCFLAKPLRYSRFGEFCTSLAARLGLVEAGRETEAAAESCQPAGDLHARVLVVEDNPVNQRVAERMLERMGCTVLTADNGSQALVLLEKEKVDLVLMDCQMPEMDGYTAVRLLRNPASEHYKPELPVIALTAHASIEEQRRTRDAGMDDYLSKPVGYDLLQSKLRHWLKATPAVPAEPPAFNVAAPLERMGGDHGLLAELVAIYLEDLPGKLEGLERALGAGARDEVVRLAHGLKGGSANIGAEALGGLFKTMERLARAGDLGAAGDVLPRIRDAVSCFAEGIKEWRAGQKN